MKRLIPLERSGRAARLVLGLVAGLSVWLIGTTVPVGAITYGTPDFAHPEAGALYFSTTPTGSDRHFSCSGALIDTRVFLTAAHCFAERLRNGTPTYAWVTFDQHPSASSVYYGGTYVLDPSYNHLSSPSHLYADDNYDFAVVHLDADPGITPDRLPHLHQLDGLSRDQTYTVVGYGTDATYGGGQAPSYPRTGQREAATEAFNSLSQNWLHLSQNPTLGNGGACGGDSGGPNYIGTSNVIAGTTITGDNICRSTNVVSRLDTETARSFLATQVSYPLP